MSETGQKQRSVGAPTTSERKTTRGADTTSVAVSPEGGPPSCREKWLKKRETKMRPGDVQKLGARTSETTEDFRYGNDWTARIKSHAGYGFARMCYPWASNRQEVSGSRDRVAAPTAARREAAPACVNSPVATVDIRWLLRHVRSHHTQDRIHAMQQQHLLPFQAETLHARRVTVSTSKTSAQPGWP